jgi:hypothetical protein
MAGFVLRGFQGMRPIRNPKLLESSEAQQATDVRLFSGAIESVKSNETVVALKSQGSVGTIFRARNNQDEALNWLEFSGDVNVALSPITQDDYGRIYWTGDGAPKYAPETLAFASGSTPYPRGAFTLGIPKPATTISALGTSVFEPDTQEREYILTFSNSDGSKQSGPTDIVKVKTLVNYADVGTLYPTSITINSATSTTIVFDKEHRLEVNDYIGITGSDEAGWNNAWKVSGVPDVKTITIENTQAFPASGPSGSYTIKQRFLPQARLFALPTDARNNVNITHKRIYRKVSGVFKFVVSVSLSETEYIDTATDTDLANAAALADSILYRPIRPSIAPNALIPFDDETINDNRALADDDDDSTNPVAEVSRAYALSFVTFAGVEGPLSKDSGIVAVIDDSTKVRVTHFEDFDLDVDKKRIYRQNVTYSDGTYGLPEASYRLVKEVPASQDVFIDTESAADISGNATPALVDAFDEPSSGFAGAGKFPPTRVSESRVYVYTYVSEYGEEGPPSDPSTTIDIDPYEPVVVTSGGPPNGYSNITKKYIYRTSSGTGFTDYQFVAEQPVATPTFTDNVPQVELGETLVSTNWSPPPSTMRGLTVMANGIFVGFDSKDVCFSEPFLPHAWSTVNFLTVDHPIVGLGAFGQSVAILTQSYPYIATGIDPQSMTLIKTSLQQACISKRSIVETGDSVIYASPDGLVRIGLGGVSVITANVLSQEQWQAYNPSSIHAYLHEGRYYAFYTKVDNTTGHIVFTLNGSDAVMTEGSAYSAAASVVPVSDSLHIVSASNIVRYDKGNTNLQYLWRSKIYEAPTPVNFGVAQVIADAYGDGVEFKLYADGVLRHTETVTSTNSFRLPSGYIARDFYVELRGSTKVTLVAVAQSPQELKAL